MAETPLSPAEFRREVNVSHETFERLLAYSALLAKWNEKINLVSRASLADSWRRHFLDSAQLYPLLLQGAGPLVDLGSGAGFPGLVLAILGCPEVYLIESDQRKCAFLKEVIRLTNCSAVVIGRRIEETEPIKARMITARAFAPLIKLLELGEKFTTPETVCLFLKGRNVSEELTAAAKQWRMSITSYPSRSDPSGQILRLERATREFPGRTPGNG